jgi:serine/threonine protein kinase
VEANETQHSSGRRFRLGKRIGKGGFGEVYLAEMSTASGFTKTVAVKLLRTDIDQTESTAQRMRDEARLLGLLRHRAIVQADDLITLAGRTALVMEFIPGVNHSWIIHPKRYEEDIPPRVVLSIISNIADALDAAYNRPSTVTGKPLQVLHRDIKPGNVRITPDGEVKVLDFGIARSDHMDREATTTEYQLGSLPYMAPELMAGKTASPASDIYSLGVCFYESLGRRRFGWAGEDADSQNNQINTRIADIKWDAFGDVTEPVENLLRRMLDFEPSNRPTGRQVLEELRELEHKAPGVSLESWAPTALDRIKKPEDPDGDLGDLVGQTLFEEVSTTSHDKDAFLKQLDEATLALSKADLLAARNTVHDSEQKSASSKRGPIALGMLLLASIGAGVAILSRSPEPATKPLIPTEETADAQIADAQGADAQGATPATNDGDVLVEEPPPTTDKVQVPALEAEPVVKASAPAAMNIPVSQPIPQTTPSQPVEEEAAVVPVKVRIASRPLGIPVLVDGKPVGKTPLFNLVLDSGPHVLLFNDGERTLREEIIVRPNGKQFWTYLQAEHTVQ